MSAATAIPEKKIDPPTLRKTAVPKRISWEEFEKKYLAREDKYKYEWVDGIVEKTERTMNQYQFIILRNLRRFFESLRIAKKVAGELEAEIDTFFLPKVHRRPDIAWFSEAQIVSMAYGGNEIPAFVIEIVSTNDNSNDVTEKVKNYRDANVKVVWLIYPVLEEVHVFHGNKMTIFTGGQLCSAAPVLPDFSLSVNEIFKKPPKP